MAVLVSARRLVVALLLVVCVAPALRAQATAVIESVVPFDSAGRLIVITPTIVSRLRLASPAWPVQGLFTEARLFVSSRDGYVISARHADGSMSRYLLDDAAFATLRRALQTAIADRGSSTERALTTGVGTTAGTGLEVSQPAGNTFVRNQTFLGLVAYGPATAALLSKSGGAAAAGGYFLAAGTSFFAAANTVRHRTVTRAQAARAAHGGTRGALTGLGIAAMTDANGGPEWGAPILAGAVVGSVVGYRHARGLSDGEAASAGLFADLGALTTIGIAGSAGAFKGRTYQQYYTPGNPENGSYTRTDNSVHGAGRVAIGAAIGAQVVGYALGPRYARRAAYNVTAGDVNVTFTSALLGGITASSLIPENGADAAKYGVAVGGLVLGALAADRGLVRSADRTSADGTLAQLGALAGALMGGGVAALAETEAQGALALAGVGGILGLLAADRIIAPAKDAGPLRGIMQSSARALDGRVQVSLGPISAVRITF
jgi:hypothetical protein